MRRLLLALLLCGAWAPAMAQDDHHGEAAHAGEEELHLSEAHGVRVLHAWTRATSGGEALVFAEIENRSDAAVSLTGGEMEGAEAALVGITLAEGGAETVPLPSVPIQPERELSLAPNELALQLSGLAGLGQGDVFELHFVFDVGEVEVLVEVLSADATRHPHAGHQH